ncbi:sulfotransferase [Vibrio sp. A2-1]|uniref:sulfotransferase family protein n=1 Tax=Vibrio sp. A2-1 TaxID=2912252 RepID=UPI001F206B99|nr:sulfotransferase [Vibrio sp. A2-1]MCF7487641.1 sulfotransferase [Vibrio sp. A2-1]
MKNIEHVFIIGNPRSGTSMFRMMLNSHQNMIVPPECGFAHWLSSKYSGLDNYNHIVYENFASDVFNSKKFETWSISKEDLLSVIRTNQPKDFESLVKSVYLSYIEAEADIKVVGDKNNYYIDHLPEIKSLFPSARFIHLVRDGRDVACSYKALDKLDNDSIYKPKLSANISDIAQEWNSNNSKILQSLQGDMISIRYEDLIESPTVELKKVCKYLGVEFDGKMLEFHLNNDEPKELLAWKKKTESEVDPSNKGKYLTILSEKEISRFEDVAEEMLLHFNYI